MFLKIPREAHPGASISRGSIIGIIAAGSAIVALLSLCAVFMLFCRRRRRSREEEQPDADDELCLLDLPRLMPQRFTYSEMQLATNEFSIKLGQGGFGCVYQGEISPNGSKVAVKRLDKGISVMNSIEQFRTEVAIIGSLSHVNLVTLKGVCIEGVERMLVYEFMARGSLDRWLFEREEEIGGDGKQERKLDLVLDWETRCRIALQTARALDYLHHQCAERVVHCDVKPENILLDDKFNAKVADFGLSKLLGADKQSFAMTTLKGTRGYLAPEWLQRATITTKSDVYSYGVVLLELISGRRCLEAECGYLPNLAMSFLASSSFLSTGSNYSSASTSVDRSIKMSGRQLTQSGTTLMSIDIQRAKDVLLDERLRRSDAVPADILERMLLLALACVNADPSARPSMTSVVHILEGRLDLKTLESSLYN